MYYILFDLDNEYEYGSATIPEVLKVFTNTSDIVRYLLNLGYDNRDIGEYGNVIEFINRNSDELGLWLIAVD